ncbi:hypothetical protein J2785_005098 [Burkholderia ambifaria]|nr:hypothetical protein [Burkholderia ambifaria]
MSSRIGSFGFGSPLLAQAESASAQASVATVGIERMRL